MTDEVKIQRDQDNKLKSAYAQTHTSSNKGTTLESKSQSISSVQREWNHMFLISPLAEHGEVMMKSSLSSGQVQIHWAVCILNCFKLTNAHTCFRFFERCRKKILHKNILLQFAVGQGQIMIRKLQHVRKAAHLLAHTCNSKSSSTNHKRTNFINIIFYFDIALRVLQFLFPQNILKQSSFTTDTPH